MRIPGKASTDNKVVIENAQSHSDSRVSAALGLSNINYGWGKFEAQMRCPFAAVSLKLLDL